MKITTNNMIKNYPELRIHTKENSTPPAVSNDGHSFDAVIIQDRLRNTLLQSLFPVSYPRK